MGTDARTGQKWPCFGLTAEKGRCVLAHAVSQSHTWPHDTKFSLVMCQQRMVPWCRGFRGTESQQLELTSVGAGLWKYRAQC